MRRSSVLASWARISAGLVWFLGTVIGRDGAGLRRAVGGTASDADDAHAVDLRNLEEETVAATAGSGQLSV